jgi:hypothetical protein
MCARNPRMCRELGDASCQSRRVSLKGKPIRARQDDERIPAAEQRGAVRGRKVGSCIALARIRQRALVSDSTSDDDRTQEKLVWQCFNPQTGVATGSDRCFCLSECHAEAPRSWSVMRRGIGLSHSGSAGAGAARVRGPCPPWVFKCHRWMAQEHVFRLAGRRRQLSLF